MIDDNTGLVWRRVLANSHMGVRNHFAQLTDNDQLIYWLVHAGEFRDQRVGAYFELYANPIRQLIFAIGIHYCASRRGQQWVRPVSDRVVSLHFGALDDLIIEVPDFGLMFGFRCQISHHIQLSRGNWCLESMNAAIYYRNRFEPTRIISEKCELPGDDCTAYAQRKQMVPCPRCLGHGEYGSMAYPKNWSNYSEMSYNGQIACAECGGQGAEYEPWFLEQFPERAVNVSFRKGRGTVKAKGMPSTVSIHGLSKQ